MSSSVSASQQRQDSQRALNKTVLIVTITYIVMTTPVAVVTSFLNSQLQSSGELGDLIINLGDSVSFSYHAYNFLILFFTNKRYSKEVKMYFSPKRSTARTVTGTTGTRN